MFDVDGSEGKSYDVIYNYAIYYAALERENISVVFDTPDSFHYIAREGNKISLIEEKIK